jgi:Raf kinase inhibitor-like YbhB/YbcL family protein
MAPLSQPVRAGSTELPGVRARELARGRVRLPARRRDTASVRGLGSLLAVVLFLSACGGGEKADEPLPEAGGAIALESPVLSDGGTIPKRFTCAGEGVSPPLSWSGVPQGARELALVVEDPDADRFVHWTVLKIAPTETRFEESRVPRRAVETDNSFGDRGWGAPCPPEGDAPHRYVFALYASDAPLDLDEGSSPDEVRRQLAEHGMARGVLTVRFGRR